MSIFAKDLLQKLIQIPSVNPSFGYLEGKQVDEAQLGNFLENFLAEQGWSWLRQTVHPGRDNLVAVCPGRGPRADAEVMLWEVHQDTVGTTGMTIDPFGAEESDGRIWGRGACDVKGPMAAMLAALAQVSRDDSAERPTIVLALCVNEECGFTGSKALCRLWTSGSDETTDEEVNVRGPLTLARLRELRPQRAIVAEPTSFDVVVAHKGVVRWRCEARGRAAHSSQPEQGANAIYAMSAVVQAIEAYQREELSCRDADPLCGQPTACVSTIAGGSGVNTVPDHAVIDIDRRLAPTEKPRQAYQDLIDFVVARIEVGEVVVEHELPWLESNCLEADNNLAWGEQVSALVRAAGQTSRSIGVSYGTDASAIATLGIPTVVFGPGSIDQAHTADEWIALDQLNHATEIFYQLADSPVILAGVAGRSRPKP